MLKDITFAGLGLSFVAYIIAEALNAFGLWREDNGKDSVLDKVLAITTIFFWIIGFSGVITLGALRQFKTHRLFKKHDRDIVEMHRLVDMAAMPWQEREEMMKLHHPEYKCKDFHEYVHEVMNHLELGNPYN